MSDAPAVAADVAPDAAMSWPEAAARPPWWTLWLGAGALVAGGSAVGWLAWVAMHVCYPRIAGDRWVLAAIAVPAGLAGGALVLCALGATVRAGHPWHATRWLRWGGLAAALGALPGLTVAGRWGWVVFHDTDPFRGIWSIAWPIGLVLAPLVALPPLGMALGGRRNAPHAAAAPPRSRVLSGSLVAGGIAWTWLIASPVVTQGPAFRMRYSPMVDRSEATLAFALRDIAWVQTAASRRFARWADQLRYVGWAAFDLWPEALAEELYLDSPDPWAATEELLRHVRMHAAARRAAIDLVTDPDFDVFARLLISDRMRRDPAFARGSEITLLSLLDAPVVHAVGLRYLRQGWRPVEATDDHRRLFRRDACRALLALKPPVVTVAPRLRAIWADPQVAEDTGYTLEALLAELGPD